MKFINKFIEAICNPFFSILTANSRPNNKGFIQSIKKKPWFLLLVSLLITLVIIFSVYHKEIFGV